MDELKTDQISKMEKSGIFAIKAAQKPPKTLNQPRRFVVFLAAIMTSVTVGASEPKKIIEPTGDFTRLSSAATAVRDSQEFLSRRESIDLIALAELFQERARQAEPAALRQAINSRDSAKVASLLGFSLEEFKRISARIKANGAKLRKEFPELVSESALTLALSDYGFSKFAGVSDSKVTHHVLGATSNSRVQSSDVSCRYVPFTAALIVCSAGGAVIYLACATVATCEFCSGGWVDSACG